MEKQAKGKNFLLVIGILEIIWSAFSIFGVVGLVGAISILNSTDPLLADTAQMMRQAYAQQGISMETLPVLIGIAAVGIVIYLLAGIIAIKNRKRTDKAQICIVMGIILIVYVLADAAYSIVNGTFGVFGVALNLVLPILYLVGAALNKSSEEA